MIKYADIKGYKNLGEIHLTAHIYQFVENDKYEPIIILVHSYEGPTEVFKGYLYNESKTFKSVDLTENEIDEIEKYTGKLEQVEFDAFINNTMFAEYYNEFRGLE